VLFFQLHHCVPNSIHFEDHHWDHLELRSNSWKKHCCHPGFEAAASRMVPPPNSTVPCLVVILCPSLRICRSCCLEEFVETAASAPGWQQCFFQLLLLNSKWSQWWSSKWIELGTQWCSWKNNTWCVKSNFHIEANLGAREPSSDSGPIKQKLKPCVDNVVPKVSPRISSDRIYRLSVSRGSSSVLGEVDWRWIYYSSSFTMGLRFNNLMSKI
jgi:hypothetical protein